MKRDTIDGQQKIQELLARAKELIDEACLVANEAEIDNVPFLDGYLCFGSRVTTDSHGFARAWSGYTPAAAGAALREDVWSPSHFECYPSTKDREWLFGKDRSKWAKTGYEDE